MLNDRLNLHGEDILKLAQTNTQQHFTLTLHELGERICCHEYIIQTDDKIDCVVSGYINALGFHCLHIKITGNLHLVCQRCLNPMQYYLDDTADIVVFSTEVQLEQAEEIEQNIIDGVALDQSDNIIEWIEDQLLLALPINPHHDKCQSLAEQTQQDEKINPFSVLSSLKTKK